MASPHRSISFSLGVIAGSTGLMRPSSAPGYCSADTSIPFPTVHALVGRVVMALGARFVEEFTSGHGLSVLSAMSFSRAL